jgi:hypothetical protein
MPFRASARRWRRLTERNFAAVSADTKGSGLISSRFRKYHLTAATSILPFCFDLIGVEQGNVESTHRTSTANDLVDMELNGAVFERPGKHGSLRAETAEERARVWISEAGHGVLAISSWLDLFLPRGFI